MPKNKGITPITGETGEWFPPSLQDLESPPEIQSPWWLATSLAAEAVRFVWGRIITQVKSNVKDEHFEILVMILFFLNTSYLGLIRCFCWTVHVFHSAHGSADGCLTVTDNFWQWAKGADDGLLHCGPWISMGVGLGRSSMAPFQFQRFGCNRRGCDCSVACVDAICSSWQGKVSMKHIQKVF